MKKIKMTENEKTIAFDFNVDLFEKDKLLQICQELALDEIYIDIFGVDARKGDFAKRLIEKNSTLMIAQTNISGIFKKHYDWVIKATINDIPMIIEILREFNVDEINIWDNYISWEKYLDKSKIYKIPVFKRTNLKNDHKVYLNYNPIEWHKVELYLDTSYDSEKILQKLEELIE